jgi:hypothetical protein
MNMEQKYRILKVMVVVFKVVAWLWLIGGVILSIVTLISGSIVAQQLGVPGPAGVGFGAFLFMLLSSLFSFGALYAFAELIQLAFSIHENTVKLQQAVGKVKPAA